MARQARNRRRKRIGRIGRTTQHIKCRYSLPSEILLHHCVYIRELEGESLWWFVARFRLNPINDKSFPLHIPFSPTVPLLSPSVMTFNRVQLVARNIYEFATVRYGKKLQRDKSSWLYAIGQSIWNLILHFDQKLG